MNRKSSGAKDAVHVVPLRRTVFDGLELIMVVSNELVLADRGGIALMRILDQSYDVPNVSALEVDLGPTLFLNVRKLDQRFELRLQAAWRRALLHADMDEEMPRLRVRIVAVLA